MFCDLLHAWKELEAWSRGEEREQGAKRREEQSGFPKGCALVLLAVGHQALADALWATMWGGSGHLFSISRLTY